MICIPITARTTDQAIAEMQSAEKTADIVEIRLDYIGSPDLERILKSRTKPVIITIMPTSEGGHFTGSEQERTALFQQAIELGAEHIDVNFGNPALAELLQQKKKTRIIVSYHNFSETPADVSNIHSALTATGADIIKIATYANSLQDSMRILDLLKISDRDMIAIAMGEKGEISRILAPLFGAYLTFASLAAGSESAPGQIPVETMKNIFRIHEINPGFHLYGIIGNPVNKSKGFRIHNRLFRHYGLNNLYLNFLVDDLPEFIEHIAPKLSGFSVTMPHKQAILKYLDEIDPLAHTIGAVNTVTNRDGILHGFNTDLTGALQPILKHTSIEGKQVTLLGAGGAARAIAVGILDQGGSLTILNRTVAKAKALARDLGCQAGPLADFSSRHTDILINMTSVGMHPETDRTPVDASALENMLVLDGIYNPPETLLLQRAKENNCTVISGNEMFIGQAAEQFRIFTGIEPDEAFMQEVLQ